MPWRIIYHHEVYEDLEALGQADASSVLKVITERIQNGEPDKLGKHLRGALAGCRRIRTGNTRIVYRVNAELAEVLVIAVGPDLVHCLYRSGAIRSPRPLWWASRSPVPRRQVALRSD